MTQQHHALFSDKAHIYAAARPTYPDELYRWLVSLCDATERAWDGACGNGQASVGLSGYFAQVEATDVSKEQIANAKAAPNVRFWVESAETPRFPDNHFDLVCIAQALHWFDYDKFWPQVQRVLKPNGIFAAWGYSWFSATPNPDRQQRDVISIPDLEKSLDDAFFAVIRPYWAPQNKLLWDDYVDVPFPFTRIPAPDLSMEMQWSLDELFNYLHSWSATRRCMDALGNGFFEAAYAQAADVWGNPSHRLNFKIPLCMLVGHS